MILLFVVALGTFGAWRIFFAGAAPNNCQKENGVDICDVDQTGGNSDTVLSINGEAQTLGGQGWGWYYGAAFRAPKRSYNGAVPIHRVINVQHSWHEWVTDAQKRDKEAKYGALTYEGVAFFAWDRPGQAGTVPIYRVTRGGANSQSLYSSDRSFVDRLLAESANNPDGWKTGTVLPKVAFYAYPPNYKVAGQANPYDCSILENFVSDRCKAPRENLNNAVAAGNVPADNSCPKTLDVYRRAPFASQFSADCQKFWNTYMQDCSILENFASDRCKTQREALARAQEEQARLRAAAAAAAAGRARSGGGSGGGGSSVARSPSVNLFGGAGVGASAGSSSSPRSAPTPSRQGVNINWGATIASTARNNAIGLALSAGSAVGNARDTANLAAGLARGAAASTVNNARKRATGAAVNIAFRAANLGKRTVTGVIGFLRR